MKHSILSFYLSVFLFITIWLFSCSPIPQKPTEIEFFEPVSAIMRKKSEPKITRTDSLKIELTEILLVQNKNINRLIKKINELTKGKTKDALSHSYIYIDTINNMQNVNYTAILHELRTHNQQLTNILKHLELYSDVQHKERDKINSYILQLEKKAGKSREDDFISDTTYMHAIKLYRAKQYKKALYIFDELLATGANLDLIDNCLFWMGVCWFNIGNIENAITKFFKVLEFSDSDKKEGSYFMLGQCYEYIGAKSKAKSMFKKILSEYPEGDLCQVAEIKIALLR